MVAFKVGRRRVVLSYAPEFNGTAWAVRELRTTGCVRISRMFKFKRSDLIDADTILGRSARHDDEDEDSKPLRFTFAETKKGYHRIAGRILGIPNDVWLQADAVALERKTFVAERNINIFGRIAKLKDDDSPIVIGEHGEMEGAIPPDLFQTLLTKFPNSGELDRYASARVEAVVGETLQPMRSAQEAYQRYLNRRVSIVSDAPLQQADLLQSEIEKYVYLRDLIKRWLREGGGRSEADWQRMIVKVILLIFPKYIAVLERVPVADVYSDPFRPTKREIDLCLVDANGALDVIEIKKPDAAAVLGRSLYRDNFVPTRELTGSVMQTEKYLFHLSKWGLKGEQALTERYQDKLPPSLSIRIANPKGLIIMGRDPETLTVNGKSRDHRLDLDVIKRQYANMVDVVTYDDLLRRLDNVIASLKRRSREGLKLEEPK